MRHNVFDVTAVCGSEMHQAFSWLEKTKVHLARWKHEETAMDIMGWCEGVYKYHVFPHLPKTGGIYIIDEQWDNLVILDACRYDLFKEMNTIDGKLETRVSRGSTTEEFLRENFIRHPKRASFGEVVYVTANPLVSSFLKNRMYKICPVWDYGWDDQLNTVPPGNVAEEALETRTKYPDKRMIVHFMQPHFPALTVKFAGETGISELRRIVKMDLDPEKISESGKGDLDVLVDVLLKRGDLDRDDVLSAYRENLRIVLTYVAKLVNELHGRTVITSDHGETFGERPGVLYPFRVFGHPANLHVKPLVVVPWLIVNGTAQTTRSKGEAPKYASVPDEDEKIKERLRKLGYE